MPQPAGSSSQDYWRPPNPEVMRLVVPSQDASPCSRCGGDFAAGAHFCHICGSQRDPRAGTHAADAHHDLSDRHARPASRLSGASLICFSLAIVCIVAAALTGVVYKTQTLADWQAVQIWRVEWLLAAAVGLLAAILLKKST